MISLTAAALALGMTLETIAGPFSAVSDGGAIFPVHVAHRNPDGLIVTGRSQPFVGVNEFTRSLVALRNQSGQTPTDAAAVTTSEIPYGYSAKSDAVKGWFDTTVGVAGGGVRSAVDNSGVRGSSEETGLWGAEVVETYWRSWLIYDRNRDRFYYNVSVLHSSAVYGVYHGGSRLIGTDFPVYGIALSPDCTELVLSDGGTHIRVYTVGADIGSTILNQTKTPVNQSPISPVFGGGSWSRKILFAADAPGSSEYRGLYLWDRDADTITEIAVDGGIADNYFTLAGSLHSGDDDCTEDRGVYLRVVPPSGGGAQSGGQYLYRINPPSGAYFHSGYGLSCQSAEERSISSTGIVSQRCITDAPTVSERCISGTGAAVAERAIT